MARVQTNYRPQQVGAQSVGLPTIQTEQARVDDPRASKAFQLAQALNVNTPGLINSAQGLGDLEAQKQRDAAKAYANSISVDELGKKIKSGEMLPSQSPAFAATLQHIYGENSQAAFERDSLSKMASGELKFEQPGDLEKYLLSHRNEFLKDQSEFTVAGFDKTWNNTQERLSSVNAQIINTESVARGVQESSDNLRNHLLASQGRPSDERAADLVLRYQLLRKSSLLRDDAAKEALGNLMSTIANSGDSGLITSMLNSKLDNGVTVQGVLGDVRSATFIQQAEREFDQAQHQRVDVEIRPFALQADAGELDRKRLDTWVTTNEKYVSTGAYMGLINADQAAKARQLAALQKGALNAAIDRSEATANQAIRSALDVGNFAFLPQQKVIGKDGELKDFNQKQAAVDYLTTRTKDLPFDKQLRMWSVNGVENPEWEKVIKAGVSNIASVGWTADGKTAGKLNEQGQAAVDTFIRINKANPAYAQKLAGGDKDYKTLDLIQFMTERGNLPVSDATAMVNLAERSGIGQRDYGSLTKSIADAVDDVVDPKWYSPTVTWASNLFGGGNEAVNLTSLRADMTRYAEVLVKTGQVADAATAVQEATTYFSKVTTKVNNTMYYNKDLPQAPAGENVATWMERFIAEGPRKVAKSQKLDESQVRLESNQNGSFTAWVAGVPLSDSKGDTIVYQTSAISKWMENTLTADRHAAAATKNFDLYRDRLTKEINAELVKDTTTPSMILAAKRERILGHIGTREAYDSYVKSGLSNKSYQELWGLKLKDKQ